MVPVVRRQGCNKNHQTPVRNKNMTEILAAVDLAGVATFVGGAGVLIIGVAMAFKAIGLGKRAVNKA